MERPPWTGRRFRVDGGPLAKSPAQVQAEQAAMRKFLAWLRGETVST